MNNQQTDDKYLKMAKLAFTLSHCHKFSGYIMTESINNYSSFVCFVNDYELWLNLKKDNDISLDSKDVKSSLFHIKSVNIKYINGHEYDWELFYYLFGGVTGGTNSVIANSVIANSIISNGVQNTNSSDRKNQTNNIESFASIINSQKTKQFKYILFSVILDYGIDAGLVHQAALLVDIVNNEFIFYEPYGTYSKYNASYANVVLEFIQKIPKELLPTFYKDGQLNYTTYHKKFGLSEGIQQKMIETNNGKSNSFKEDVDKLYDEINKSELSRTQQIIRKVNRNTSPVKSTDLTYDSIIIAQYFLEHPYNIDIEDQALQIYGEYNSKTCVSITITELDKFFSLISNKCSDNGGNNKNIYKQTEQHNIVEQIQTYHSTFENDPNKRLLERLYEVVLSLEKNEQIINALNDTNHLKEVCAELKKII